MKQKELPNTFIMILILIKPFGLYDLYKQKQRLKD